MTGGSLTGRVAVVTGAATGLGRAHAEMLARAGAAVTLVDLGSRTPAVEPGYPLAGNAQLEEAAAAIRAAGGQAIAAAANVHHQDELDAAVAATLEAFGRIDILVAAAGIAMVGPALEMDREAWDLMLATNLTGAWQTCKAVAPAMVAGGYGRIVLISSIAGYKPMAGLGAYSASKAALLALTKVLALELAEHGITVNAVCPSTVPSGTNRGLAAKLGVPWDSLVDGWLDTQAIKTLATPDDISHAVAFLVAEEARLVTGVALPVDAGTAAR
jgi:NAD(P)-dependent dehydrogenase (short-subunit alcohol dehydrogenase family)